MKRIYVNLKRFDVPVECGGVNRLAPMSEWAQAIVYGISDGLSAYAGNTEFTIFFPESHLILAGEALNDNKQIKLGCQGVYRDDIIPGGNYGAFTTKRPAAAAKSLGCKAVLIGHCEERRDLAGILAEAGVVDVVAVNRILNNEIQCALKQGLEVLYCIGETATEQVEWQSVLHMQLETGLDGIGKTARRDITIAYEPVWAIGPEKMPPDRDYIQKVACFVKKTTNGLPIVYGGGLKADNASMLASIDEIDGGLIALTRFSGEIGFYPDEYLKIVHLYLMAQKAEE